MHVQNSEQYHADVSEILLMNGIQCIPWADAAYCGVRSVYYLLLARSDQGLKFILCYMYMNKWLRRRWSTGCLVYRFRKQNVGKSYFLEQFRKLINRYKRIGYSLDIVRQTACLVINPIIFDGYVSLFNCKMAVQPQTQWWPLRKTLTSGFGLDDMSLAWPAWFIYCFSFTLVHSGISMDTRICLSYWLIGFVCFALMNDLRWEALCEPNVLPPPPPPRWFVLLTILRRC